LPERLPGQQQNRLNRVIRQFLPRDDETIAADRRFASKANLARKSIVSATGPDVFDKTLRTASI
jgi:hypothetical protein